MPMYAVSRRESILVKHILKNSMHTCIVAIGMSIPQLISGTIVVENVFAWPGLGTLCISSIFNRDYPVIQSLRSAHRCPVCYVQSAV